MTASPPTPPPCCPLYITFDTDDYVTTLHNHNVVHIFNLDFIEDLVEFVKCAWVCEPEYVFVECQVCIYLYFVIDIRPPIT